MAEYIVSQPGKVPNGFICNSMDEAIDSLRYVQGRWGRDHQIYVRAFGQWLPVDEEAEW